MRVLLDTTYAARAPYSGTAIYLRELQRALAELGEVEVKPVSNPRRGLPAGGGIGSIRNLLADGWWTSVELPRLAIAAGADVIHHALPAHSLRSRVPQVVTVHDLSFERLPDLFDRRFRFYAHRAHRAAARAAAAVICVSGTTAADVRELWDLPPDKVVIAPHGPGQMAGLAPPVRPREHFLYVGDDEPRKNVLVLLAAYAEYRGLDHEPVPLILAGAATAVATGVIEERSPSRERLAELYAGAVALVHPSLYEGFGMTALEAMSVGAPVIAADSPGLRETCGDAAVYADPHSPSSFASAMARIARDETAGDDLAERGRARAGEFSWARSARAHVEAYSLAASRR